MFALPFYFFPSNPLHVLVLSKLFLLYSFSSAAAAAAFLREFGDCLLMTPLPCVCIHADVLLMTVILRIGFRLRSPGKSNFCHSKTYPQ